jgi:hypothetical protein
VVLRLSLLWGLPLLAACAAAAADPEATGEPRTGLPHAQGRSFASLDEYLAFLEERGSQDVPWYRKIGPDTYELVARRGPRAPRVVVTRRELMDRFGFVR